LGRIQVDKTSSPLPPSPRGEGGNLISYSGLAPLPWERGWGEAKKSENMRNSRLL